MRNLRTWMSVLAALALCGCASRRPMELLEARLRQQEDVIADLRGELARAESDAALARHESQLLRDQLAGRGEAAILPEQVETMYRARGIQLNRWFTGALDGDGEPGDDLLSAVVVPLDDDGQLVKVPGAIRLELLDLSQPEGRRQIGQWEFDVEETRRHWQQGFLNSGYYFKLPWQQQPQSSKLVLRAVLTTVDGRRFDTSQEIRVTPPPRVVQSPEPSDEPHPFVHEHDAPEPDGPTFLRLGHESAPGPSPSPAGQADDGPAPPQEWWSPLHTSDNWTEETIPRLR